MKTSMSRRLFFVKTKFKHAQSKPQLQKKPAVRLPRSEAPRLAARTAPPVIPKKTWWAKLKALTLTGGVALAMAVGIYLIDWSWRPGFYFSKQPHYISVSEPGTTKNEWPSNPGSGSGATTYSAASYPDAHSESSHHTADSFITSYGGRHASAVHPRSGAAAIGEGQKLVLPDDVSGNCDIGNHGTQSLRDCFARQGASAQ